MLDPKGVWRLGRAWLLRIIGVKLTCPILMITTVTIEKPSAASRLSTKPRGCSKKHNSCIGYRVSFRVAPAISETGCRGLLLQGMNRRRCFCLGVAGQCFTEVLSMVGAFFPAGYGGTYNFENVGHVP